MSTYNEIQCPACSGKIIIDTKLLLSGGNFSCTTMSCNASVSLSNSSYHVANSAMDEFDKIKTAAQLS
ncbi:MAG: hypothetical protein HRU38_19520 [Saccharospirillaceae bacterium]|nr:hypothetical protein [Pseudomonadales bacterium]NRB80827.1 hypothetical protein [Saccharospirillaceae bacterium]